MVILTVKKKMKVYTFGGQLVISAKVYPCGYPKSIYTFIVVTCPLGNIVKCVKTFLLVKMTGEGQYVQVVFGI